jgi:hypothetical protein
MRIERPDQNDEQVLEQLLAIDFLMPWPEHS